VLGTGFEYDLSSPGRSAAAQPSQPPQTPPPAAPGRPSRAAASQSIAPIQEKVMPVRIKRGAKKGTYNFPKMVTLLKELGAEVLCTECSDTTSTSCLYEGCLNWSYFLNDGLGDAEAPAAPAPTKTSKKGSKKSGSKGSKAAKKKAAEAAGPTEEDAAAAMFQ